MKYRRLYAGGGEADLKALSTRSVDGMSAQGAAE